MLRQVFDWMTNMTAVCENKDKCLECFDIPPPMCINSSYEQNVKGKKYNQALQVLRNMLLSLPPKKLHGDALI